MRNRIVSIMNRTGTFSLLVVICFSFLSCSVQPSHPEAPRIGPQVGIEVKTFRSEVPEFFTYRYRGKNINFFVIKIADKILSFLDACASCYPAKKAYRFDDGRIIRRACNVGYSVNEIEKGIGSCVPIRISGNIRDSKYLIPVSELEGMADKF